MARIRRASPQTISVLEALAREPSQWSYGYDICRSIGLKPGTVYPILIRLAERGQVEAVWERDPPLGRPARHLYRLSSDGADLIANLGRKGASIDLKPDLSRPAGATS